MDRARDNARYGLPPDYAPNLALEDRTRQRTGVFWTEERIARSSLYQYDAYRLAAELMARPDVRSVLDVGCGPPVKLRALMPAKPLDVHLVDDAEVAPLAHRLLPAAAFTAADLETVDADLGRRFDLALCIDVLEHLVDPDPCLAFLRRHLAPGGRLLVSTPDRDALRGRGWRTSPHPDHVREWNGEEFARFLGSRGWRIERRGRLPAERTAAPLRALGALLDRLGTPPRWYSCQYALCMAGA